MRKRLTALAALPLLLTAVPAGASPATCASFVSHRGYLGTGATENGMPAIRAARTAGAPWVEVDLARTSDDYVVLMHDRTIDRTTNGTGYVYRRTRSYLRNRVRLNDGSRVPTLDDVLGYASRTGLNVQLELKTTGTRARVYRRINNALTNHGMRHRVLLASFDPTHLRLAATYAPGVRRALISDTQVPPEQVRSVAGVRVARVNVWLVHVTPEYVATMHAAGYQVAARLVDEPDEFRAADASGVDSITTNNVPEYVAYCARG